MLNYTSTELVWPGTIKRSSHTCETPLGEARSMSANGSLAATAQSSCDVRFTPESGHRLHRSECPLWAMNDVFAPQKITGLFTVVWTVRYVTDLFFKRDILANIAAGVIWGRVRWQSISEDGT